jgi:hypothetical protein
LTGLAQPNLRIARKLWRHCKGMRKQLPALLGRSRSHAYNRGINADQTATIHVFPRGFMAGCRKGRPQVASKTKRRQE